MKSKKEAQRIARQLMKATVVDGGVNMGTVKTIVSKLAKEQPRGYLMLIDAYHRLVRMELEKNHAVIESAEPVGAAMEKSLTADLKKKYGNQLTTEFKVVPELLGGMRVKVGSDVLDGSVRARLQRLEEAIK